MSVYRAGKRAAFAENIELLHARARRETATAAFSTDKFLPKNSTGCLFYSSTNILTFFAPMKMMIQLAMSRAAHKTKAVAIGDA